MCERPKIHVFLGAPPPSSGPASVSEVGAESVDRPPAGWGHLELTWTDGHLRPAADEAGNQSRRSREEGGASGGDATPDRATLDLHDQTNTHQGSAPSEADWTTEASQADTYCNDHKPAQSPEEPRPEEPGPEEPGPEEPGPEEPGPEEEDQCSASVHQYLDSCFPAAQPGPEPRPPAVPPLCPRTQYLTTWTLSQALILRGRHSSQSATSPEKTPPPRTPPSTSSGTPELFSPVTPSPGASAELFSQPCSTPRVEEGGVVLQPTTEGVLCSQEAESTTALDSPAKPPDSKRARVSEESRTEVPSNSSTGGLQGPTTPLVRCHTPGVRYSVLVAVVHPCHLKEVQVKSGPSAGTSVPLASIVVIDQSDVEMKVVLWRRAAFWVLTVSPGDILLITGLQVNENRWSGETVLQSTFSSKLLSLGQVTASSPVPQHVSARSLSSLFGFLRERRPLLLSLPRRPPQDLRRLPYAALRSLRVNMLVHALLRVTHTHLSSAWRSEAESRCKSAVQLKAVVTVEQPDGQQRALLLWGGAVDWLPRFNRDRAVVWDFHILLVREGLTSDLPELHSTPWSSVRPLDPTDRRAQDFLPTRRHQTGSSSSVELDLDTLLSQRHSGDVELRVQVTSFHFQDAPSSQNAPQPVLDSSTPLDGVLEALSGDVTYTGCGRCCAELETDANGIYGPCYPCLPHTAIRRYYRPGVLTVSGQGSSQVCVQVPPLPLLKILDAPPDKLHRISAPGSQVKHIQVAAERIQNFLSLPRKTFIITIRSHFLCDENSVPLYQDFTLLDFQFSS